MGIAQIEQIAYCAAQVIYEVVQIAFAPDLGEELHGFPVGKLTPNSPGGSF